MWSSSTTWFLSHSSGLTSSQSTCSCLLHIVNIFANLHHGQIHPPLHSLLWRTASLSLPPPLHAGWLPRPLLFHRQVRQISFKVLYNCDNYQKSGRILIFDVSVSFG